MDYHIDDHDELTFPLGDKPGDDNSACIFCDSLLSDDVKVEV